MKVATPSTTGLLCLLSVFLLGSASAQTWRVTTVNLNQTASLVASSLLASFAQTQKTQPSARLETLTDKKSGLEFVRIPKGQYPELLSLSEKQLETSQKRKVTVGPIWIGITDVTVAAYEKCAKGKACSMDPASRDEPMNRCAWKNGLLSHPINCITWKEAVAFCTWVGGRLPTPTEWEYAATSGNQGKNYPWGESPPDGSHANYCDVSCPKALGNDGKNLEGWTKRGWIDKSQNDGWAATSPVGTYPAGATPWGLLDMAGNVWQWTSADAGDGKREVRGGSWDNPPDALRTSKRLPWPENADAGMGFRCVKD
jgi:formylglycine-generating enzyme required for sulfatase activity